MKVAVPILAPIFVALILKHQQIAVTSQVVELPFTRSNSDSAFQMQLLDDFGHYTPWSWIVFEDNDKTELIAIQTDQDGIIKIDLATAPIKLSSNAATRSHYTQTKRQFSH